MGKCNCRGNKTFPYFLRNLYWGFAWARTVLVYLKLEVSNFIQDKCLRDFSCYFFIPLLFQPMLLKSISDSYLGHFEWRYLGSSFFQFVLIAEVPKETEKVRSLLTGLSEALLSVFGVLHAGTWNTSSSLLLCMNSCQDIAYWSFNPLVLSHKSTCCFP